MKRARFGLVCTVFTLAIIMIGLSAHVQGLTLDNAQTCNNWYYVYHYRADSNSTETVPVLASTFLNGNTVYLYYTVEDTRNVDLSNKTDLISNNIDFTLTGPSGSIVDNFLTRSIASQNRTLVPATDSSPSKTIESAFLVVMNVTASTQNGEWTISGSYEDKPLFNQQFVVDTTRTAPPFNLPSTTDNSGALFAIIVLAIFAIVITFIVIGIRKRNQRIANVKAAQNSANKPIQIR